MRSKGPANKILHFHTKLYSIIEGILPNYMPKKGYLFVEKAISSSVFPNEMLTSRTSAFNPTSDSAAGEFLSYIHNFRALAIIVVVAGHCIDVLNWESHNLEYRILSVLFKNGTYFFVFISGFLFRHLFYRYNFCNYIKSKTLNIILPYLVISIPAIIVFTFILKKPYLSSTFYDHSVMYRIIYFYITGSHLTTYWYIPMIVIVYLAYPLLKYSDRKNILCYLLPMFICLSCYVKRGDILHDLSHFVSVYILGMVVCRYKIQIFQVGRRIYCYVMPCVLVSCACSIVFHNIAYIYNFSLYTFKVSLCFLAVSLLNFFDHNYTVHKAILGYIAKISFGIYFIHPYLLSGFRYLNTGIIAGTLALSNAEALFFSFIGILTATMLSCVVLIQFCKFIFPKWSRYIIGC